ncbi:MAG: methyltransferase domain-containing protein [Pseudomonadota bacterium]
MTTIKLNLGCGSQIVEDWVNVDYALGARLMKIPFFAAVNRHMRLFNMDWDRRVVIHDLRKAFPWNDGSVGAIYSSHTLEHLSKEDGRNFLSECHRVLRPGGLIRIVVPDLKTIVSEYVSGKLAADDLLIRLDVLPERPGGFVKKVLAPYINYPHQCMYDTARLIEIMRETGFDAAGRDPFDSSIEGIRGIERADRTTDAVIVEGRKP